MASELTPLIGLYKAIPGTNEPFRAADINDNWDILDTFIVNYEDRFSELETEANEAVQSAESAASAAQASVVAADAALAEFEVESQAAIDALDTDAIISAITTEGFTLDIDGGTA
jgi:hypothetical protein